MEIARYFLGDKLKIVTVEDYQKLVRKKNKKGLADIIYNRLYSRYIKPFSYKSSHNVKSETSGLSINEYAYFYKNGFSIMATCCLLIETLEAFYQGWGDAEGRIEDAFKSFFERDKSGKKRLELISTRASEFYKNVRCGILHQGETRRGWKITRERDKPLFDIDTTTINATLFLSAMESLVRDYKIRLETDEWDSPTWDNCRRKMRKTING